MKTIFLILLLTFSISAQEGLLFNGVYKQHVNHGLFWEIYSFRKPIVLEKDFAWEAWVKISPDNNLGYVISSGYGGAHAILLGFTRNGQPKYALTGNFTVLPVDGSCADGHSIFSFGSNYVFDTNEWVHVAVASKDYVLRMYKNGQVIATRRWEGLRISSDCSYYDASAAILYVGGSDHLNFTGAISQVRGWEGVSPYDENSFTPQTKFTSSLTLPDKTKLDSVFLASYNLKKGSSIEDFSNGYKGRKHPGTLFPTRPFIWKSTLSDSVLPSLK